MKVRWGSYWELDCIFTSQKRSLIFPYKLLHFRHDSYFARWSFHTWSLGCLWLRPTQVDPLINNVSNRVANENSPQCILDFETTGKCLVTISRELRCEHASLLVLRHKPLSNASRWEVCKGSGTNNVVSHILTIFSEKFQGFFFAHPFYCSISDQLDKIQNVFTRYENKCSNSSGDLFLVSGR